MGNCLITKLKSVVENNNLDYLGKMVFNITAGSKMLIQQIKANVGLHGESIVSLSVEEGKAYFTSYTDVNLGTVYHCYNVPDSVWLYVTQDTKLTIDNHYDLISLYLDYADFNRFTPVFATEKWKYTNLESTCAKWTGSILDFPNTIKTFRTTNGLTGDIKDLVSKLIAAGRTTGDSTTGCNFTITEGTMSFNGKSLVTAWGIITKVCWESASKIYLDITTLNIIYTLGYSDAEIATNTASGGIWEGKTVTKRD